jgi:hypothetical protein
MFYLVGLHFWSLYFVGLINNSMNIHSFKALTLRHY